MCRLHGHALATRDWRACTSVWGQPEGAAAGELRPAAARLSSAHPAAGWRCNPAAARSSAGSARASPPRLSPVLQPRVGHCYTLRPKLVQFWAARQLGHLFLCALQAGLRVAVAGGLRVQLPLQQQRPRECGLKLPLQRLHGGLALHRLSRLQAQALLQRASTILVPTVQLT